MLRGVRRSELAFGLLLALLAGPVRAAAGVPDWDAGDVEAADRYRALERERALRFRAAAEERLAELRRGERPRHDRTSRAQARGPRASPAEREPRIFEPWVHRLGQARGDAVLRAFVQAAHDAWLALREAVQAWLEDVWGGGRPRWTDADWRPRE